LHPLKLSVLILIIAVSATKTDPGLDDRRHSTAILYHTAATSKCIELRLDTVYESSLAVSRVAKAPSKVA
jgi:hypothetical protein